MTTDVNCGQVRGPIQFSFSRSIDPIVSAEHAVTRCAVTTQAESDAQEGGNRTIGRKFTVPYAPSQQTKLNGNVGIRFLQHSMFTPWRSTILLYS